MSIKSFVSFVFTCAAAAAFVAGTALAADPAVKCESGKLKEASKYSSCRLKADSKAVKKDEAADYAKCEAKFADKWAKAETKAGVGICPSEGDQVSMDARITTDVAEVATLLAGGTVSVCGDGSVGGDESCDGADLAGADCTTLGFASGTLGCTAGCGLDVSACVASDCGNGVVDAGEDCDLGDLNSGTCTSEGQYGDGLACGVGCAYDTSACSATRYEDTGLGSVIDHQTGLEWQKTDDAGGLTDKDNTYTWTGDGVGGTEPNGTAFLSFLDTMNGGVVSSSSGPTGCHAGHCDWRIPHIGELTTILDCAFSPCIDQSVFGATNAAFFYWSSSTTAEPVTNHTAAWIVFVGNGGTYGGLKNNVDHVRAVRGGS
jgi:hypothetical protein